jgi:hypothetical protein
MTPAPRDPNEYQTYAHRRFVLAEGAADLKLQKAMLAMARRWSTLAVRLGRAREIANRPPRNRTKK